MPYYIKEREMRDISNINMDDIVSEYDSGAPEQDSGNSKKKKEKEDKHKLLSRIPLPPQDICAEDKFDDEFTLGIKPYLRRFKSTDRDTTSTEIYVKDTRVNPDTGENEDKWLLLSYYKNKQDVLTLVPEYEDANKALDSRINEVLKPIAKDINAALLKCKTSLTTRDFGTIVGNKLPTACGYYSNIAAVLCGDTHYTLDRKIRDNMYIYCILLALNNDSGVENIKYITNDESEKDQARYFYSIKPSQEKFNMAPDLKNYSPLWYNFLHGRFVNERMDLLRLTHHLYSMICQECHTRQALALFDTGDAGKSVFAEAIARILPGAMCTGVSLQALTGPFPPASINGARGIIIDEGQDLQSFFDDDFFKSITGAVDDNTMKQVNRKMKDYVSMRLGALRFMFLTNSKLCIKDKAGLTRISPMLFMPNYGRKRDGEVIVNELMSEGPDFIQYCIDSETYYRNLTSKKNHWWCPIIEDNGTVNILTDAQFDAWYNETSEEWHFNEEEFNKSSMRDRINKMNLENIMQATTDPKTGMCHVYGSLDNDIAQDALQRLVEALFTESKGSTTSLMDVARYFAETIPINNNEIARSLREIGFKNDRNLTASSIIRTQVWKCFKTALEQRYKITAKKDRSNGWCYNDLLFTKAPAINVSKRNTKDE